MKPSFSVLSMKQKDEIIKDLEDQILPRLKEIKTLQDEVSALQSTVDTLRGLDQREVATKPKEVIMDNDLNNYPGYPLNGSLIDKYRYLEDKTLRVWLKQDMEKLIGQIEGKKQASKTLKDSRNKAYVHIQRKELIRLKYSNKNSFSFFTTRSEWIEREQNDGKITFRLLPQHEPEPAKLLGLSEEHRKSENISWSGII